MLLHDCIDVHRTCTFTVHEKKQKKKSTHIKILPFFFCKPEHTAGTCDGREGPNRGRRIQPVAAKATTVIERARAPHAVAVAGRPSQKSEKKRAKQQIFWVPCSPPTLGAPFPSSFRHPQLLLLSRSFFLRLPTIFLPRFSRVSPTNPHGRLESAPSRSRQVSSPPLPDPHPTSRRSGFARSKSAAPCSSIRERV
jgi:hypothetical protein